MHIDLEQAIRLIRHHQLVAIRTETIYGLAASLSSVNAIKFIFTLKKRPLKNPLIVHIADKADAEPLIREKPPLFDELADRYWPGPLTLVVPASDLVPEIVRAGLPTVGLRVPRHPLTQKLLEQVGPLVAPSANLSGNPSSTSPTHVECDFGKDFPVIDGGSCEQGLESTILVYRDDQWQLGRLGSISCEELEALIGYPLQENHSEVPLCPGQHFRHYSPRARLVSSDSPYQGTPGVVLGFEEREYANASQIFSLGNLENPETISRNLYKTLRQLDAAGIEEAWVDLDFPGVDLLRTIKERLRKACFVTPFSPKKEDELGSP